MADKKISQLDSTTSVNSDAVFPLSQTESGSLKTVKGTVEQIGDYIAKTQDHSTLNTTSKKIIGAINEILASGIGSIEGTASGSVASFADGGDNIPVKSLIVDITAQQAGSGTPTPSSPLAITGWSGAKITRCGKNFWSFGDITSSENDIPFSLKAGTYNLSGTRSGTGTPSISIRFYYADGTSTVCQLTGTNSYSNSVTLTADVVKINKYISAESLVNVQLEKGSSKTTFEAYKGNTYTIALGSTVYGGTLDVTKGVLTVTHGILDMGSVDWVKSEVGDYSVFYYVVSDKDDTFDFICSCFKAVEKTMQSLSDLEIGTYNSTNAMNRLVVRYDSVSTSADFKTAVTGQYVVYRLATPVVIQLTPNEVKTLLGENNIYANSGDVEVEYFNEDASQINELIETIITSSSSDYHVYSTEEKVVGRWIDGKPIYEKTFVFNNSVTIGKVWTATGFTITNGSFIINSILMSFNNNGTIAHSVNILPSTGAITLSTDSDYTNLTAGSTLTVQYIKTTD